MPTKPLDYFTALLACLLAATLYEVAIAPAIVGQVKMAEIPIRAPSDSSLSGYDQYFKPNAWQRQNPKQIETQIGVLLYQNWERLSDKRWKISPVTLMLRKRGDKETIDESGNDIRRPILLEAPGGAEIELTKSLSVLDGTTPTIQGGHLIGNVQILGPATQQDGKDRLQINASDIRINGQKIWTTAAVRVQVGAAVAEGRDLTITLAGGGNIPTQQTESPLSVLDELTLIYLDRLSMPLPKQSLWPALPEVQKKIPPGAQGVPGMVGQLNVRCGGALRFDFATYTMTLNNRVQIQHQGVGLPIDSIECPNLAIELEDPFANNGAAMAEKDPQSMVRRVRAYGGLTTFDAPTLLTRVTADTIDADFRAGVIQIKGQRGVDIVHRAIQMLLTDFEYRFTPGEPTDLIQLKSSGNGKLISLDQSMPFRSFGWKEQLRITPDVQPNKYQLWMLGAAAILPEDGRIRTDSLRIGFFMPPPGSQAANALPQAGSPKSNSLGSRVRPESLVANGNVVFDTPEVFAQVQALDLYIEQINQDSPPEKQLRLTNATGQSVHLWTREPKKAATAASPGGQLGSRGPSGSKARPHITGGTLSADVLTDGVDAVVPEFSINDNVRIEHLLQSPQGPLPVVLTGRELVYVDGNEGQIVQVSGFPAQVAMADGHFRGPMVQLRLGENSLFMDQAGEFQLPSNVLINPSNPNFRWIQAPRCSWQGQMHFNGRTAQLVRDVKLTGAVTTLKDPSRWDLHIGCPLLELELAQRIDFSDPQSTNQAKVEKVTFRGINHQDNGVVMSAVQRDLIGGVLGSHQMNMPSLELYPQRSGLMGAGPGWYHMWSKPKLTDSGPLATLSKTGQWLAAHLVYQEKIVGNFDEKSLRFLRGVRVATSPVPSAEHRIDARQIIEVQNDQAILDCDELEITQTPVAHQFTQATSPLGQWEIKASSNVAFQGRNEKGLFGGKADRMGYIADKDLFVIEGARNRPAELQRWYATGAPGGTFKGPLLKFKPRSLELIDLELQYADLGDLQQGFGIPAGNNPPPQPQAGLQQQQQPYQQRR